MANTSIDGKVPEGNQPDAGGSLKRQGSVSVEAEPVAIPAMSGVSDVSDVSDSRLSRDRELQAMLRKVWQSNQPVVAARMEALRLAHVGISQGDLGARRPGLEAAHKLAGVLGTFGLPRGSQVAREAEALLEREFPTPQDARLLGTLLDELAELLAAKP